jgi:hypothetical protein
MIEYDVSTLPKWAQKTIRELELFNEMQAKKIEQYKKAHELLENYEWFTLDIPKIDDKLINLYVLRTNDPLMLCSVLPGDKIMIGRNKK